MDSRAVTEAIERLDYSARGVVKRFQRVVLDSYTQHGRIYPWRETTDPYSIVVSEFMLQQTQTDRVRPKYENFLKLFPDWEALASAPTSTVVRAWEGLGYYRRARNLQLAAKAVVAEWKGVLPALPKELVKLPGIGPYTAAAIAVFAFRQPYPMIETNIRTVYLHTFFAGEEEVHDARILTEIERTLYAKDPRAWFYALMDVGVAIKKTRPGVNKRSKHYTTQTPYEGSVRQMRAAVIKTLTSAPALTLQEIASTISMSDADRLSQAVSSLLADGFIMREGEEGYRIA